jgi:hypothetical protein
MSSLLNAVSTLYQDWKYPRTSKAFIGSSPEHKNCTSTIFRCVTNTKIPCTAKEFAAMGKTRFTVTVLGVSHLGWAYAPFKKAAKDKKTVRDPNAKDLFELVVENEIVKGVKMFSFKKAKSNFDRDERDNETSATLHVGQVWFRRLRSSRSFLFFLLLRTLSRAAQMPPFLDFARMRALLFSMNF